MHLVVGATGTLGRQVVRLLLDRGHAVRALTRDPGRAADLQARGAEVARGDVTDAASLARACEGATAVLACAHAVLGRGRWSSAAVDDAGHRALIDAARAAGVGRLVYTSVLGASPVHPVDFWRTKHAVEAVLRASGVPFVILRPAAFMEAHAHQLLGRAILEKGRATVFGSGEVPMNYVAAADVAHVAAWALLDDAALGRTIEIGGPDNLTRHEVVELYARAAGRAPRVRHVSAGTLRALATLLGPFHPGIGRVLRATAAGETLDQRFAGAPATHELGLPATSLEEFVRARVAERAAS